jgi:AAA domain
MSAKQFRLIPFDELTVGSISAYLVKGIIPRRGLVLVWGPPKCGKSFWMMTVALHVALGWEYRGHRVRQGTVVYLALEGQEGYGARAEAFRQRYLAEEGEVQDFYLVPTAIDLVQDHRALLTSIREQSEATPAMVVIDTLNRSLVGSERSDEDMSAYVRAADTIRDAFRCVVAIVHHCGVDEGRPRGHTSLSGAADAQIAVKRDGAKNIVVKIERMKDGPEGAVIVSRLEQVQVGIDQDGDPITSCAVIPVDVSERVQPEEPTPSKQKLPKGAAKSLELLKGLANGHDITETEWREACYSANRDKSANTKRRAFYDAKAERLKAGRIAIEGETVRILA